MSGREIKITDLVAVIDSRELKPLQLHMPSVVGTLACADYSLKGLEHHIAVERKELNNLLGCVGRDRERFEKCVKRMQAYEVRALVIEADWDTIEKGVWRSSLKPSHVKAALFSWSKHISIFPTKDRKAAAATVSGILFSAARERWRELQSFYRELKIIGGENGEPESSDNHGESRPGPGDEIGR